MTRVMIMENIAYNDNCNLLTSFLINDEWFRLMSRLLYLPRSICMPLLYVQHYKYFEACDYADAKGDRSVE